MENTKKKSKYKDWKFWALTVIPITFGAVGILLDIALFATKYYNLPLIMLAIALIIVSITVSLIASLIKGIKSGSKRKLAYSIISSAAFIVFVVVLLLSLLQLPKIFTMERETEELWQQYIDTDSRDKELVKQRLDSYLESKSKLLDVSRPTTLAMQICTVAVTVIQLACSWIAGDFDRDTKLKTDDNKPDNATENEQR